MAKNKDITTSHLSRRTVVKGAAWSVPVIAVAAAAPAAAASETTEVSNFSINGDCGILGAALPGFVVTADSATPIPAGSVLTISASGLASIGVLNLSLAGGLSSVASISLLSDSNTYQVTFNSPFSGTGSIRSALNVGVGQTVTAALTLPDGYVAGEGAKSSGSYGSAAVIGCEAS